MAKDLKKFVNPKFKRTIDLGLMRRLLQRHKGGLRFDLAVFEEGDDEEIRSAIQDFFAGPEDNYPEGLVADLHRIAELGNASGLELILQQADRLDVDLRPEPGNDDEDARQDPKHVALRVFLDHHDVFEAASDMMALMARSSLAEFVGRDEGIEAIMEDCAKVAFEEATARLFERDLRSNYCRIGWYDDADELVLVVEHGSPITTTDVVEKDQKRVISFRAAEHAVLSYTSTSGLLKIGGVAKARRAEVAEIFAGKLLGRPEFFAGADAQNLYTLEPIRRAGFGFTFNRDFDPGILRVQITEVQVDRIGADPKTGDTRVFHSYIARDGRDNALARLGEMMGGAPLGQEWRLNHIVIRIHFATGGKQAKKVTAKVKPPAHAMFKRQQFEGRIMTLLRRNGLLNDRATAPAAVAAE